MVEQTACNCHGWGGKLSKCLNSFLFSYYRWNGGTNSVKDHLHSHPRCHTSAGYCFQVYVTLELCMHSFVAGFWGWVSNTSETETDPGTTDPNKEGPCKREGKGQEESETSTVATPTILFRLGFDFSSAPRVSSYISHSIKFLIVASNNRDNATTTWWATPYGMKTNPTSSFSNCKPKGTLFIQFKAIGHSTGANPTR